MTRWDKIEAYDKEWSKRSQKMLEMFDETVPDASGASFSEYGCGPYMPFRSAVSASGPRKTRIFDRMSWAGDCEIVDFNTGVIDKMTNTDVGVLSGVLEYLDDVPGTLALLRQHHRFALISYAVWEVTTVSASIVALNQRCNQGGWRNHYTLHQIVTHAQEFGVILRAGESLGQIVLLLAKDLPTK
ncbi:hypothetical protein [Roseibium sediminicola]|uniref:Methyltransferase domain-containing protein n=1 Tax=Roseibium sediminicola TaxID=2933272 RepID=A0ABT0H399_9HYPH|nr:hypothetical protein [Roseibium sp. CAU 1639]MCK7616154.1 hypothetical protein [Roseibium sp. CAU 1639]